MQRRFFSRHLLSWGGAILIACYFLGFTWRGLDSYFSRDDLMNVQSLHGYWEIPLWRLFANTFLVWLPSYRPFGGVVYRLLFFAAGMNPAPFRIFCFLLLFANLVLVYRVVRILTNSVEMAFLATLLFAYHPALFDLYYDSATLYDLLCCALYFTTIWIYVKWRAHPSFTWIQVAVLLTLLLLALQSKEMALTLPVMLTVYEIFYHRKGFNRCLILMYILTGAVLAAKLLTRNALSANPLYYPQFSLDLIGHAYAHYYHLLFPALPLGAAWVLIIVGLIWRAKPLWFGLLFFVVALSPVVVVPPRSGFVMYIPMLGLALATAFLLVALRDAAVGYLRISSDLQQPLFCVVIAAVLMAVYSNYRRDALRPLITDEENLRAAASDLPRLRKTLRPGANVLLLNDPMSPESWECTWLFRLLYADPRIWVDRRRDLANADAADLSLYDCAFENRSGQYAEVALPPPVQLASVKVIFTPSRVHQGEAYTVSVEEYPDSAVDVAFWMVKDSPIPGGVVRNWCSLDKSGSARLIAPLDAPVGTIVLKKARRAGAAWRPAEGSLEVIRR